MRTVNSLVAAGATDTGRLREVNEDRFHADDARGLFIVGDGIGGQAAGGRAADVALSMLRQRLERETGPVCERVREAIAIANNEIYRLASTRPEWDGMACVLTVAVVKDGVATIGHVGDTRLYKLRGGLIDKITHDHSPIGEREDAHEISELDAMRHPRRNEVYRDVGSEPHTPSDADFVEVHEIPFELDEALLLCSDGLTDCVDDATIAATLAGSQQAGEVCERLVQLALDGGGHDNITVIVATFAS
jgi:serine/threonine protein phosphatase PrpC